VVWHHWLLLMNGFNKTEAAVFSCRLRFLRAFLFVSLIKSVWCQNRIELTYKCHFVYYSVLKLHFFMHFCIICLYQIFLFIYSYLTLHWLFTFKKMFISMLLSETSGLMFRNVFFWENILYYIYYNLYNLMFNFAN